MENVFLLNYERHKFCQFTKQNAFEINEQWNEIIGNFHNSSSDKSQFTPRNIAFLTTSSTQSENISR